VVIEEDDDDAAPTHVTPPDTGGVSPSDG
jgi:hypothetical protein